MAGIKETMKGCYCKKVVIYFMAYSMILNTSLPAVMALEAGDVISQDGVIGSPTWGDNTVIDTDHGAIINWNNFNTDETQSVTFKQYMDGNLNSASAVLNRITSGNVPTEFNGALNANGRVFVVNPAGVIFGGGATVNVAQLVASGLNMTDEAFNAVLADVSNEMVFEGGDGEVQNFGDITADSVYLVGKKVLNSGSIVTSSEGLVIMAAGDNVYLAQDGSSILVELLADPMDTTADVQNDGIISAPEGQIILAAGDMYSRAIANFGTLEASAGTITAHAGLVETSGIINVDADNGDSGSISLTASEEVVLAAGSLTTANAGTSGNGGEIIVHSEGNAIVSEGALIEAKGGSETGDGGFVEISGEHFIFDGDVDASAVNGEGGTLLIDPMNLTLADGANAGATDTFYEQYIEELSQIGMQVFMEAEGSITVEDILDNEITGGNGDIVLYASGEDSSIYFADTSDTITTTLGDIVMLAGGGGINIGNLDTGKPSLKESPGEILLSTYYGGNIQTGYLSAIGGGDVLISVVSTGDLKITGNNKNGAITAKSNNVSQADGANAEICLAASGDVDITNGIQAKAHGKDQTTADIKIYVGEDVDIDTHNRKIKAWAQTSGGKTVGTADATIKVHFSDSVSIENKGNSDPIRARAKVAGGGLAKLSSSGDEGYKEKSNKGAHALIDIAKKSEICPDCPQPEPPVIIPPEEPPIVIPPEEPPEGPQVPEQPTPGDGGTGSEPYSVIFANRYMPVAPIAGVVDYEYSGCTALMKWMAEELGIGEITMQIWMINILASTRDIHPCEMCARLKEAATVLQDTEGTHIAALAQVINQFASTSAPPSEEQMALIADAIARNAETGTQFAAAGEYLDALAEYVGILNGEMNLSTEESVAFAVNKYIVSMNEVDNVGLATYIASRLAALGG